MIYGPRKTEELARRALALRADTGRTWKSIAAELGVSTDWLRRHAAKFGEVGARLVATPENIKRAKELRAARKPWKVIARELGLDDYGWLRREASK